MIRQIKPEEWREIVLNPDYAVSNLGRIKRLTTGTKPMSRAKPNRVIKTHTSRYGYACVSLRIKSKHVCYRVHRLVAEAFIGPCPPGYQVNHKDGNKLHNADTNLEYVTGIQNMHHAYALGLVPVKLTREDILQIQELGKARKSYASIGKQFHVTAATIGRTVRGQRRLP